MISNDFGAVGAGFNAFSSVSASSALILYVFPNVSAPLAHICYLFFCVFPRVSAPSVSSELREPDPQARVS